LVCIMGQAAMGCRHRRGDRKDAATIRRGALGARTNEHCSPAVALLNVSALLWKS
jgi:hypothetical protein